MALYYSQTLVISYAFNDFDKIVRLDLSSVDCTVAL